MTNKLPKSWDLVIIKDLVLPQKGKKPKKLYPKSFNDSVPYLDIKAIERSIISNYADVDSSVIASKKDILIVWDGARSGWVGTLVNGAVGSTLMKLKPIIIDSKYIFYFLRSKFDFINSQIKGIGIPHVNQDIFWNINLPLAPIQEQKRISSKLDMIFKNINSIKYRLAKFPNIILEARQQILHQAFTGQLTKVWRKNNKGIESADILLESIKKKIIESNYNKKEINRYLKYYDADNQLSGGNDIIPVTWLKTNIGSIGLVRSGSTPSRQRGDYWGGNIPWVSSGEVRNNLISSTREKISRLGFKNSAGIILPKGTVLLAMIGEGKTRGQSAILKIAATINQNIVGIILDYNLILPEYLFYWFQYTYQQTRSFGSGSGPKALNSDGVRELPFNLAPFLEQKEIVKRTTKIFQKMDKIENKHNSLLTFVEEFRNSVLDSAYAGKLAPQNPNDEPVEKLLERIKKEKEKLLEQKKATQKRSFKKKVKKEVRIMEIIELLKKNGKMKAVDVWKQSEQKDDIEKFYAKLKTLVDKENRIRETKKGKESYLELIK